MKIIIIGIGKVGQTLAVELSKEGYDITILDRKEDVVEEFSSQYDIMGIVGNGASYSTQLEAGIEQADLMIAVTGSDEMNMLCCLIARKAGHCHTIARVRNPEYSDEMTFIKEELGLAMVINPELAAASEIARLLKYPSAIEVDSFAKSRVELMKFRIPVESILDGLSLAEVHARLKKNILICAVERAEELIIPDGSFRLRAKDLVTIVGDSAQANEFFKQVGLITNQVRSLLIVGGGTLAYYLAKSLLANGIKVKIIDKNMQRCEELSELLPRATIIYGDGTDKALLQEEGLLRTEAFASLTNIDEENILLSLYAKKVGKMKVVTKINRIAFDEVIRDLELDTLVHPKNITAEHIIRYVRSMKASIGSNVETMHRIIDNKAEALEFYVREDSSVTGVPLQDLHIRKGILVACIRHEGEVIIPRGQTMIQKGDTVIIITRGIRLNQLSDIVKNVSHALPSGR